MTKVYGCSDDLVEIEPVDEIDCFDCDVYIRFSDNTLIKVYYEKNNIGIWGIEVLEKGTAKQTLTECNDKDAEIYSDVFEIDADYIWHREVIRK